MVGRKRGITLVELLVVLSMIGILVALLLPAIQSAREGARRTQCTNNLKQIGAGVQSYADAYKTFPVGNYHCVFGTWLVHLLPFVEQGALYDRYVNSGGTQGYRTGGIRYDDPANWPVTMQQLAIYSCPSDSKTARPNIRNGMTFHNYVANYGNTTRGRLTPYGRNTDGTPNDYGGAPFIEFIARNTGNWPNYDNWILHDNRFVESIRPSDITDGASNTLLISETIQGRNGDLRGMGWWGGGCHFETYLTPNTAQPDVMEADVYCVSTAPNSPCVGRSPGNEESIATRSRHSRGVQVNMCDGSVRFISDTVMLNVWRAIGTGHGAETFTDF